MKNSLLCVLCLLLSIATAYTSPKTSELIQVTLEESHGRLSTFDSHAFLGLIEEYTHFTKTEPLNISEELAITSLIERLSDATTRIEFEIRNNKIAHNGTTTKKTDDRLRQYSDSAKTALRELNKRHGFVKSLAQNSSDIIAHQPQGSQRLIEFGYLSASYQSVRNILPARTRIKDCLLNSPMLTTC